MVQVSAAYRFTIDAADGIPIENRKYLGGFDHNRDTRYGGFGKAQRHLWALEWFGQVR